MSQIIFDDPEFFAGYSGLPRSVGGLASAPEWPVLRAMLPDVRGLRIVDLGCGFGWFCRWARQQRAAEVLGVDHSHSSLAIHYLDRPMFLLGIRAAHVIRSIARKYERALCPEH